uniref:BESS domain-containing protein n=2 Tax=Sipha flava TaxID=143950 RepID=A0A2S2PZ84_9HEMI
MSDLSDSEEVNSFSSSFIYIEGIQSPENPVSVTQSECFTIPSTSNLSHVNISTSISNDSDTSSKTSSIKRKKKQENKSFESELLKLETQKINALLESNKPLVQDDEDMMFLKSLHPYLKNMDDLQK